MTHTGPMRESEGELNPWQPAATPCRYCGSTEHFYRIWESSDGAYEDEKHECRACKKSWWVDGIDS